MRVAVFGSRRRVGVVVDDYIVDVNGAYTKYLADYYMEQVGWDGTARSGDSHRCVEPSVWPEMVESLSDTYSGETFWGQLR